MNQKKRDPRVSTLERVADLRNLSFRICGIAMLLRDFHPSGAKDSPEDHAWYGLGSMLLEMGQELEQIYQDIDVRVSELS